MKVIKLTAENVKRLKAVEITPDGNVQVIAGRNAQGKSSVLDAIWMALGGGPAAKGTTKPIRDGEDHAQVTLDLGQIIVTRTWKGDKTTLTVSNADGAVYRSPQALLDSLVGRLSFDPLAFAQQEERKQLASLLELVELPFDVDELAARRGRLYEQRTDVGRRGKQLEGQLAGILTPPADTPNDEVSVAVLVEEHRAANQIAAELADWQRQAESSQHKVEQDDAEIARLEAALAGAKITRDEHQRELENADRQVDQIEATLPDINAIAASLAGADAVNTQVRLKKQRADLHDQITVTRANYVELGKQIDALDQQKADAIAAAIAAAKMPIDGLAFDDTGVTYNSVPFKQCSAAEQLRVSIAMSIALNPQLRVILIKDASLLDSENMRIVEEMAIEHDAQIWLERVDETGTVGVVIEDGSVRESAAS